MRILNFVVLCNMRLLCVFLLSLTLYSKASESNNAFEKVTEAFSKTETGKSYIKNTERRIMKYTIKQGTMSADRSIAGVEVLWQVLTTCP